MGGIILVSIVTALFLGNFRASLIVISSIPLTLFIAFIIMYNFGMSGNLMTLGGLAIGIGMFVDSSVVVVENIYRHLTEKKGGFKISIIHTYSCPPQLTVCCLYLYPSSFLLFRQGRKNTVQQSYGVYKEKIRKCTKIFL